MMLSCPFRPQISSALPQGHLPLVWPTLCHGLCHNPAIPARSSASLPVSLGHTQKAVNVLETRMNTAFRCRSVSLPIYPSRFTRGNGMEEVVGSNPVVASSGSCLFVH